MSGRCSVECCDGVWDKSLVHRGSDDRGHRRTKCVQMLLGKAFWIYFQIHACV